jgi:hypothetical protein
MRSGVSKPSEPAVDPGEHRARPLTTALFGQQPREAGQGAQFSRPGALLLRDLNRPLKAVLSFFGAGIILR